MPILRTQRPIVFVSLPQRVRQAVQYLLRHSAQVASRASRNAHAILKVAPGDSGAPVPPVQIRPHGISGSIFDR
jgi:hypothetical protein